jgi:hypothetical protein
MLLNWNLGSRYHVSRDFLHVAVEASTDKLDFRNLASRLQQMEQELEKYTMSSAFMSL